MQYTVEALIKGDSRILGFYTKACDRWNQILIEIDIKDTDALCEKLQVAQGWFEHNCGGKNMGQEIMVLTGIGQFYSTKVGFDPAFDEDERADRRRKAVAVLAAFRRRGFTMEMQGLVKDVQQYYRIMG
jgi:hypothetical protein